MTQQQSKWNADAEVAMMGYTIAVESEEHLTQMVRYTLEHLKNVYPCDIEARTKEIVESATRKYRSGKDKSIQWFAINATDFGTLLTFVRDKGAPTKRNGVLAWVENLDAPDCSELGYVFFQNVNGKVRRVA